MRAFITGVTGQDGSYLSEYLLLLGYEFVGLKRRTATNNLINIQESLKNPKFTLVEGDITDPFLFGNLLTKYKPDEIYNLAAQSHVHSSFSNPIYTQNVNYLGVVNLLESIRAISGYNPKIYQASTSEQFGNNYSIVNEYDMYDVMEHMPLDLNNIIQINKQRTGRYYDEENIPHQFEGTPFNPQSPYAVAKVAAHNTISLYREAYGMKASCGILFNHEGYRRPKEFVTRKITSYLGRLYNKNLKFVEPLHLGNLDAYRDWGWASEYVQGMHRILQEDKPDDYVIATGETHSIKEFIQEAFRIAGIPDWTKHVVVDNTFKRPAEVNYLKGCANKIKLKLGWEPKVKFADLINMMVDYDIKNGGL